MSLNIRFLPLNKLNRQVLTAKLAFSCEVTLNKESFRTNQNVASLYIYLIVKLRDQSVGLMCLFGRKYAKLNNIVALLRHKMFKGEANMHARTQNSWRVK